MNRSILSYDISTVERICSELGQPRFRAKQLVRWLYQAGTSTYDEMSNLPAKFREELVVQYPLVRAQIVNRRISTDGTRKYVLEYDDGARVETVGIPSSDIDNQGLPKHLTVCFSTQVGCGMGCIFCATGTEGFTRNLSSAEQVEQILIVQNDFGMRVSNVVSMGQGEPFQNYDSVLETFRFLNSKDGFGIGARHMTLSTCGIISGIEKLSREPEQFTLAVSLHAARQEVRDTLIPRCKNMPLPQLKDALLSYVERTGRRPSLEYTLIKGMNDSQEDLDALIDFTQGLLCHVNLIPLNEIDDSPFKPVSTQTTNRWVRELSKRGKETTIRNSRGADIDGACGQLKNKLRSQAKLS
jgi:23S rRNA (adenine2503-C2)-methyltransferase